VSGQQIAVARFAKQLGAETICWPQNMAQDLEQLKRQFLEYVEIERGRALKTVENYNHYLTVFLEQTKAKKPSDITDNTVREFRLWLNRQVTGNNRKTGETMSKKTQNYYSVV